MVWYGMVWYGMVWYGMIWYGMVWHCIVWHGMAWHGLTRLGFHDDPAQAVAPGMIFLAVKNRVWCGAVEGGRVRTVERGVHRRT